jgi:hypothetical protein
MIPCKAMLVVVLIAGCLSVGCISSMVDSYTGEDVAGDVRANGLPASGRVLKIWETGVRVNDNPVVGFLLEIHAEGIAPYEAETKALISILWIPRIQPGEILPVKYDPDDPSRVALDIFVDQR